jgi:RNA polymerase sigma-70 factor (ECF subfamily)
MEDDLPASHSDVSAGIFAQHRGLLTGVAYRVLSSISDAEDAVQDAWLRWSKVDHAEIKDPRAYLVRVTTRVALDRLRRRKAQREEYYGEWLPEPVLTGLDVAEQVELTESISTALLVILETLSPLERAVFVLRETFSFSYAEIAEMLDRSEPAVRQLAKRARAHVSERRPRFEPDPQVKEEITNRFFAATMEGDLAGLMAVLAPDVTVISDSGGKARAPLRPVIGADNVARFFVAVAQRLLPDQHATVVELNGSPGLVATWGGVPIAAATLGIENGLVRYVYLVVNPEKLQGLRGLD